MLTPFGKELRKMRIDRTISLKEMAQGLGFSSAYLSAIENGKKAITESLFDRIVGYLKASEPEIKRLQSAKERSINRFSIDLSSSSDQAKETMLAFARRFEELPEDDLNRILKILEKGE